MTTGIARRLLGDDLAVACARRGIALDRIDWSMGGFLGDQNPGELNWYRIVKWRTSEGFCEETLPLFARLLQMIENDEAVGPQISAMFVTLSFASSIPEDPGVQLQQTELTALLVSRVASCLFREGTQELQEELGDLALLLDVLLSTAERLRSRIDT